MLGIIWTVLKIILLIIGVVLSIVLLLLAALLFAPIKYSGFAEKDETTDIKGKASWLFGMVRAEYVNNDDESELILKYPFKKKEKAENPIEDSEVYIQQISEKAADETLSPKEDTFGALDITDDIFEKNNDAFAKAEDTPIYDGTEEKANRYRLKDGITRTVDAVKQKAMSIRSAVLRLKERKNFIDEITGKYDIIGIAEKTVKLIMKLFKNIGFKVLEINGIIGFEDPSVTGKVLGVLAASDHIIPGDIIIDGDFENKRLEGSLILSGRTNIFRLLLPIVIYLLRKPVRPVVIDYLRGDKNE